MKILSLNCQKGHHPRNENYLAQLAIAGEFDFVLLQEAGENIINNLKKSSGKYAVLAPLNHITGAYAQTPILYLAKYKLEQSCFFPAGQFIHKTPRIEYGMTLGRFSLASGTLLVANLHTHSGPRFWTRKMEVSYFKQKIVSTWQGETVIIGGDFNSGYPWEHRINCSILAPEFIEITRGIRHTCDSKYLERSNSRTTILSYLGKVGINFRLATDHVFIDRNSSDRYLFSWKVSPERVSDHLPIEINALPLSQ